MPDQPRLLIVPGLHDSGETHWQTDLQRHHRHARRVQQRDWSVPSLEAWADRVLDTIAAEPRGPWIAVAHSFGCLALVRALLRGASGIEAAVLVAPADPLKFGVAEWLPCQPLPVPSTLVASRTDPWMPFGSSVNWSRAWGSQLVDLGDAGHINVASGHGPWPLGRQIVARQIQKRHRHRRIYRAPARTFFRHLTSPAQTTMCIRLGIPPGCHTGQPEGWPRQGHHALPARPGFDRA